MNHEPAHRLHIAEQAVAMASEMVHTTTPGHAMTKGDRDMVTDLDIAIERRIRAFLAEQTPQIGFLGEEQGGDTLETGTPTWVLDPIDGTANLLHHNPLCAISLALVADGEPQIGVVEHPLLRGRYTALKDHGGYCDNARLHGGTAKRLTDAIIGIGDYAVGPDAADRNKTRLAFTQALAPRAQRIRMLGSVATDLTWAASGRLDGSLCFSNKPWDTAAGTLIAREAGLAVLDLDGTPHSTTSTGTLAAPGQIADELLELLSAATVQ